MLRITIHAQVFLETQKSKVDSQNSKPGHKPNRGVGELKFGSFCPISTDLKHPQIRVKQTFHPGHQVRNEKSVEHRRALTSSV